MSERYQLKRRLGQGGMGEVFLASSQGEAGFSKPVVIKRMLPQLALDEGLARMFLAEAQLATHFHHQNIVEVFDVGRGPQGLFIAMELVDGWELSAVSEAMAQQAVRAPAGVVAFIATQVLAGLSHAYRRRKDGQPLITAHRDISPSNILVSREGEVKLADFGIAKVVGEAKKTDPGTFRGKLQYAAPEIVYGEPATHASDEFALAISLYELIGHQHPFWESGTAESYARTLESRPPKPLTGVPTAMWDVLQRMLALQPRDRFGTVDALLTAWTPLLGSPAAGTRELADFLGSMRLPPPPSELPAELGVLGIALAGATWSDPNALAGDWTSNGVELDPSGKVVGARPRPAAPPVAPTPRPVTEPALELASVQYGSTAHETGAHSSGWSAAPVAPTEPEPPPEAFPLDAPPARSHRARWVLAAAGLVALGAGALLLAPKYGHRVPLPMALAGSHMLQISSEPPGATVSIGGNIVGKTPLFIDNAYAPDEIRVELSLRGYRPWTGTFRGSQDQSVSATLLRR